MTSDAVDTRLLFHGLNCPAASVRFLGPGFLSTEPSFFSRRDVGVGGSIVMAGDGSEGRSAAASEGLGAVKWLLEVCSVARRALCQFDTV